MIHWARTLADLPEQAHAPCVLICPVTGDQRQPRAVRRKLAIQIAEQCFGEAALQIRRTPAGALRFFDGAAAASIYLSHATREGLSVIAVGRQPLGVDLERIGPDFEPAWNILHAREKERLASLSGAPRHQMFLEMWTAKEAALKLTGVGLLVEPGLIEWRGHDVYDHVENRSRSLFCFIEPCQFVCALVTN